MVVALAKQAQNDGVTLESAVASPTTKKVVATAEVTEEGDAACDSWPPLCTFYAAFGFDDQNSLAPIMLGVASLGMVWIFAEVLHMRSRRMSKAH